jgi:hypothetical protein
MRMFFLLCLSLFAQGQADYVVIGGFGSTGEGSDAPEYPLANQFSLGDSSSSVITMPPNFQGRILNLAIDPYRGTTIYVGENQDNSPIVFRGSVVSSAVAAVPLPSGIGNGIFTNVAIDSDGNAIIVGYGQDPSSILPLIYRLSSGAREPVKISLPNENTGELFSVVIAKNNTAIIGGANTRDNTPLILSLSSGATQATLVSLNDLSPVTGYISAAAAAPDGSAILGGANTTTGDGEALIYSLPPGSLAANPISVPDSNDGGLVNSISISSNGIAILAGAVGTGASFPLIYSVLPGDRSAHLIANANDHEGMILSVAIGSDGTAILGGSDATTNLPLIYKLANGADQATSIQPPNPFPGAIISVAIGSQDIAVLAGTYIDRNQPLLFTLPITSNEISSISASTPLDDLVFSTVAIYNYNGLYDIRRLRPYYYLQIYETTNKLNRAGFP